MLNHAEGNVVSFDIDVGKVGVGACSKEMSLGVPIAFVETVTEMTDVSLVVARCSAIWEVNGFSSGCCPECAEADLKDVTDGCRNARGEPKMVAGEW